MSNTHNIRVSIHDNIDSDPTDLNSSNLLKLLNLRKCAENDENIYELLHSNPILKKVLRTSNMLKEETIYTKFYSDSNFLLKNTHDDISESIEVTKHIMTCMNDDNHDNYDSIDFADRVNPYGLEDVVYTGGGTKGHIYIGTLLGLLMTGQMYYLKSYAGSSIGGLTALVMSVLTPTQSVYEKIRKLTLNQIATNSIVLNYELSCRFIIERFVNRDMDSFYDKPTFSLYGLWSLMAKIMEDNGLYNPDKSGFFVWYVVICTVVCKIMDNGLDEYITIHDDNGKIVVIEDYVVEDNKDDESNDTNDTNENNSDEDHDIRYLKISEIDTISFKNWKVVDFYTFNQYNLLTGKSITLTGTRTDKIETVYYNHNSHEYCDLSVAVAARASMSVPWVFKAPIINNSYHLDGGIFDNYPLVHLDVIENNRTMYYNNRVFGYFIDDQTSIIDPYEILKELWLSYDGFRKVMNIGYLMDNDNFENITKEFFLIREELFKLLYYTDLEIMDIVDNKKLYDTMHRILGKHTMKKCTADIDILFKLLKSLLSNDNDNVIGSITSMTDLIELSMLQAETYRSIRELIDNDICYLLKIMDTPYETRNHRDYYEFLCKIMGIMSYYELKGMNRYDSICDMESLLIENNINNVECSIRTPAIIMSELHDKMCTFGTMINEAIQTVDTDKQYMQIYIDIANVSTMKMKNKGSYSINDIMSSENMSSSYQKAINYFMHTDMIGILSKYMSIASDRICSNNFNRMRTIKLNTYETETLHFGIGSDLKSRLIYEGYSKTIRYFASLLKVMEITGLERTEDYIESENMRLHSMYEYMVHN